MRYMDNILFHSFLKKNIKRNHYVYEKKQISFVSKELSVFSFDFAINFVVKEN